MKLREPLPPHDEAWKWVRGGRKLDSVGLTVLQALVGWRAKKCIARNRAPNAVVTAS